MKRILITFITVFSMCCLVACDSETTDDVATGSSNEVVVNIDDKPTAKPVAEATVEPTEEPSSEVVETTAEPTPTEETVVATPEPTEEPELYPGIDMESDLSGEEWVATFIGVIEEPKVVIFNDETGRKEIVEEGSTVTFNPDKDTFVLYLPGEWKYANKFMGPKIDREEEEGFVYIFRFNAEDTRLNKFEKIKMYTKNKNGEEKAIEFIMKTE